jgi:anti-sigma regulatory factor (Ser/Thr protein kinase)
VTTVELRFSALPVHVRTARLVAASVARRAGVDDALLDEVRLAVGEACSRVVGLHQRAGLGLPVEVRLHSEELRFSVEVADSVSGALQPAAAGAGNGVAPVGILDGDPDSTDDSLGLLLITSLVDDVTVVSGADGATVRMSWPVVPS